MQLEKEGDRLAKLVETGSTLPSLEELDGRIEKATRELDKKDDKIVVSLSHDNWIKRYQSAEREVAGSNSGWTSQRRREEVGKEVVYCGVYKEWKYVIHC